MKRSTKLLAIANFALLTACGNHILDDVLDLGTGLEESDLSLIPEDVRNFSDADASSLPSRVSIEQKFPPVQSQGQYGTCVAWSTGYAFKTALNAIDKNWSPADLERTSNQTSPKDLWIAIPADKKNSGCNGVAFEYALDALISKGAASMADVPYNMASSCDANPSTARGNTDNKLANYRKIAYNKELYSSSTEKEGMDLDNFKNYLAQGRPVLFAAKLGDRFRRWNNSTIISSDNNLSGGHAMVLVGYDDSKRAFRVRNSWGTNWGDNGSIWVDYDFFLTNFCKYAFVAQNPNSSPNPSPSPSPSGDYYDLLTNYADEYPDEYDRTNPRKRAFSYEVYNNGTKDILASQKWGVYFMYYNAYNANEYKIIYEDYYTNERGSPCTRPGDVCWGRLGRTETEAIAGGFWNNMNVKPGKLAGEVEAGGEGYVFEMPYEMPSNVNGDYYLVVYADYKNVISESNEDNNFYFITDRDGKPLKFVNGVRQSSNYAQRASLNKRLKPAPVHSVVELGESNGYTPQEIKTLLNRDKKNGVLAKKIAQYREENTAAPVKRIKRRQ